MKGKRYVVGAAAMLLCVCLGCGGESSGPSDGDEPECQVSTNSLRFGNVEVDSSSSLTFTIENTGAGMVSGTISETCDEFEIIGEASYSLAADESQTFVVEFTPASVGAKTCTIETGSDQCGDVACTGTGAPPGDYYVDASSGNDTYPGTIRSPFRTITHAVSTAGPNKTICVLPGNYDEGLGETFPIRLESGQTLIGDVATKGAGTVPVTIYGAGDADPAPGNTWWAALVGADGVTIEGLSISAPYTTSNLGVYLDNVTAVVSDNTFTSATTDLYGGVRASGSGASQILRNDFRTSSYGVMSIDCTGGLVVEANLFETMSIPMDLTGTTNNTIIRENTIIGSGQTGIQVQNGVPLIENNTFNKPGGYLNYGAIRCAFAHANPTIRGNTFICARGVRNDDVGTPDLGTVPDAGGNDFSGVTGAAVYHMSSSTLSAIGNTWASQPPECGVDIVLTGTGSVVWGTEAGEACP